MKPHKLGSHSLFTLFTLFTLLAYLNYTPRLRYTHEDQIHYSRTWFVARVTSQKPTVHRLSAPSVIDFACMFCASSTSFLCLPCEQPQQLLQVLNGTIDLLLATLFCQFSIAARAFNAFVACMRCCPGRETCARVSIHRATLGRNSRASAREVASALGSRSASARAGPRHAMDQLSEGVMRLSASALGLPMPEEEHDVAPAAGDSPSHPHGAAAFRAAGNAALFTTGLAKTAHPKGEVGALLAQHSAAVHAMADSLASSQPTLFKPTVHDKLWRLRFLLSSKGDVTKATANAAACLKWREENGMDAIAATLNTLK